MTMSASHECTQQSASQDRHAPRVAVIQDGARLHYAAARSLALAGMLERMFTEWYMTPKSMAARLVNVGKRLTPFAGLRRLAERRCDDIPSWRVAQHPLLGLYLRLSRRWFKSPERYYQWCSEHVFRWIRSEGWGKANAVFGYVRNVHPALCEDARRNGLLVVVDQMIAPASIERDQYRLEQTRWPGWEEWNCPDLDLVVDLERKTWDAAQQITCASEYVKSGLIECGVRPERVSVIHYPIEVDGFSTDRRNIKTGPVTVGFIGHVGLRKGAPYFQAVARRLKGRALRFVMVGPSSLSKSAREDLGRDVELSGPAPRSRIPELLSQFDMFLFPSTCEGSAGAVTEAMAAGLPIVTSPNSGTLVEDGVHGFIRAYDDVEGVARAVDRLAGDAELRRAMGQASRRAAERCNVRAYGEELIALFRRLAEEASDPEASGACEIERE